MLETKIAIKKTALLVIDMQNDILKTKKEPFSAVTKMAESKGVIGNTAKVIAAARQVAMPIIFTNHVHRKDNADAVPTITDRMLQGPVVSYGEALVEGTPGAAIVDELKPALGDHVIYKRRGSSFYGTDLELMLRSRGIDTLIITGVITNGCIQATVQDARERDFHVIVLSNCCATMMPEDDDYFITKVFPGSGRVRTSDEIIAAMVKVRV